MFTQNVMWMHTPTYVQRLREEERDSERRRERLREAFADKRCRGQLCSSRLRDKTSRRDHNIFLIPNFKEETYNVFTFISLAFFNYYFWHLVVGNIFLLLILYLHNWNLNLSFLAWPWWIKRADGSSRQSFPYFKTIMFFMRPSSLD